MQRFYSDLCALCCTKRSLGLPEPTQCMHCDAHIAREKTKKAIAEYTGLRVERIRGGVLKAWVLIAVGIGLIVVAYYIAHIAGLSELFR